MLARVPISPAVRPTRMEAATSNDRLRDSRIESATTERGALRGGLIHRSGRDEEDIDMTPGARVAATIELLDEIVSRSERPADLVANAFFTSSCPSLKKSPWRIVSGYHADGVVRRHSFSPQAQPSQDIEDQFRIALGVIVEMQAHDRAVSRLSVIRTHSHCPGSVRQGRDCHDGRPRHDPCRQRT